MQKKRNPPSVVTPRDYEMIRLSALYGRKTQLPHNMLSPSLPILVDADALIALVDTDDPHSARAFSIAKQFQEIEATLLYPATTFQRKLNKPTLVAQIVAAVSARQLLIDPVDAVVLDAATALFKPQALPQSIALSS